MNSERRPQADRSIPPLLTKLYGCDRVCTLQGLLPSLCARSTEASHLFDTLVTPQDHPDYSQGLLQDTFVVLNSGAPPLRDGFTLQHSSSQTELVHRVVDSLLRSGSAKFNVLCFGYRKKRPSLSGVQLQGAAHTESYSHSSITALLQEPVWQLLLSRIGDTLMLYLLLHTSMFLGLPNNCCLQLTGLPIANVARGWRATAEANAAVARLDTISINPSTTPAAARVGKNNGNGFLGGERVQRQRKPEQGILAIATQGDSPVDMELGQNITDQSGLVDEQGNGAAGVSGVVGKGGGLVELEERKKVKRQRPSSWQRKKARKSQTAAAAAAIEVVRNESRDSDMDCVDALEELPATQPLEDEGDDGNEEADGVKAPLNLSINQSPVTQIPSAPSTSVPLPQQQQQPLQEQEQAQPVPRGGPTTTTAADGAGGGGIRSRSSKEKPYRMYAQWPLGMARPSDMVIPRSLLYCATFCRKPGLPSRHFLNKLNVDPNAGRIIYSSIFDTKHNPLAKGGNVAGTAYHINAPLPAARVPKNQRHLLPLLEKLAHRVATCPYGVLLNKHCPMPAVVTAPAVPAVEVAQGHTESLDQDLDTLMDELYELEQGGQQTQQRNGGHVTSTAAVASGIARTATQHQHKRIKDTGLHRLISEAGHSLKAAAGTAGTSPAAPALPTEQQQQQLPAEAPAEMEEDPLGSPAAVHAQGDDKLMTQQGSAGTARLPPPFQLGIQASPLKRHANHDTQEQQQQQQQAQASVLGGGSSKITGTPPPLGGLRLMASTAGAAIDIDTCYPSNGDVNNTAGNHCQDQGQALGSVPPPGGWHQGQQHQHRGSAVQGQLAPGLDSQARATPTDLPPTQEQRQQQNGEQPQAQGLTQNLAACFVPHSKVTDFVWSALRCIVPKQLLGDKGARSGLKASLRRFIGLRRWENMTVHQAAQGIRISSLQWLTGGVATAGTDTRNEKKGAPPNLVVARQRRFSLWLAWLFSMLVVPLLRAHFYCTETENYRQQVFYYRKPVWARLTAASITGLQQDQFKALSQEQALRILTQRKLGVSRLRLLPKRHGMRFIINMGKASRVLFKGAKMTGTRGGGGVGGKRGRRQNVDLNFRPVNNLLQNLYQVLKFEASRQPAVLGSSVFGYNDIYCRLQPFIRRWKAAAATSAAAAAAAAAEQGAASIGGGSGPNPNLTPQPSAVPFIVSADVSRAFDHVDIETLLNLIEPLLLCDSYLVMRYQEVVSCFGTIRVVQRKVAVPGDCSLTPFPSLAGQWAQSIRNKVFLDQVVYDRVSRLEAMTILRQHLSANIVKLRRQWHYQSRGIAQGSTLGTLMCSIYLAHVEKTHIMPVIAANRGVGGVPQQYSWQAATQQSFPQHVQTLANQSGAVFPLGAAGAMPAPVPSSSVMMAPSMPDTSSHGGVTALAYAACALPSMTTTTDNNVAGSDLHGSAQHAQHAMLTVPPQSPYGVGNQVHGGLPSVLLSPISNPPPLPAGAGGLGGGFVVNQYGQVMSPYGVNIQLQMHQQQQQQQPQSSEMSTRSASGSSVLVRLVDDWLLVTSQESVAQGVATSLLQDGGHLPPLVFETPTGAQFIKWCGLLVNVHNLEIQGDYTRYVGEHISTTLTLPLGRQPGAALGQKLCHYLRPKIHPLLLDASINSPTTIRLNIYQAFLLGAMKFHNYVRALPAAPAPGTDVLEQAVDAGIVFMYTLTRSRKVPSIVQPGITVACSTHVSKAHVRYLGMYAFRKVLQRKQKRYEQLLQHIEKALHSPVCLRCVKQLEAVVDPALSSVFDDILY